jgi:hypothetical protein
MDNFQYSVLKEKIYSNRESVAGQFISILSVTDAEVKKEYKTLGIKKVSRFQAHIISSNYIELNNKSERVSELGIELKAKRPSYYENESKDGFFRCLKSNPDKKYLGVKYDTEKNHSKVFDVFYVDENGKYLLDSEKYLKEKKSSGREDELQLTVRERDFKVESIACIRIAGEEVIDSSLLKYTECLDKSIRLEQILENK